MNEQDYPIGSVIVYNTVWFGPLKGIVTSSVEKFAGRYVYPIKCLNNEVNHNLIYFPHQDYGYTFKI